MKIHHSTGSICLKGPLGLIYNVARIDYYLQENDEYEYNDIDVLLFTVGSPVVSN